MPSKPRSKKAAVVKLPPRLDGEAAALLAAELRRVTGRSITLDASSVERVGGQGLQVLLAASRARAASGQAFGFAGRSPRFDEDLSLLGVDVSSLCVEENKQ